ncbi:MAG: hypothetical protein ABR518_06580 [Actinomycetota bacterium]
MGRIRMAALVRGAAVVLAVTGTAGTAGGGCTITGLRATIPSAVRLAQT